MIQQDDMLPDWAYSDSELDQIAIEHIEICNYSTDPTNVVFYHLLKDGENTGLVMILAVKSILDGQEAIDRLWSDIGITAIVGEYNDESVINQRKAEAMYLLLQKHRYKGKVKLPGADKVFIYQEWYAKLIEN